MRQQNLLVPDTVLTALAVIKMTVKWQLGQTGALGWESQGHILGPHFGADSFRQVGSLSPFPHLQSKSTWQCSIEIAVGREGDEVCGALGRA